MTPNDPGFELTPTAAFVREAALLVSEQSTYNISRATIIIGRYVAWAEHTRGLPLAARLMFDPQVIDLYVRDAIESKRLAKSSVAEYRAVLRRGSEMLLPRDLANQIQPIPAPALLAPYSADEVDAFQPWMLGQRTNILQRKAIALTCLGLGCGLRAGEINRLRRVHVIDDGGIIVTVPDADTLREVPMSRRWEPAFRRLIEPLAPDDHVFGAAHRTEKANAISEFVQDSNGLFKPSSYRMRSTWIVGRLAAQVDLPTLLQAAGLSRLEKLADFLPYLPQPTEATFATLRSEVKL
ncbi:MAG: hypothetical protein HIU88_14115 [Acidobacteria bacterium]|nr:hypothetical protein [Acidobacteriota bacterium]